MSPKKTGNTLSCSLLMYLPQTFPANAEYAPRAAARDTALRAVEVLTSCQILPEPLVAGKVKGEDPESDHPRLSEGGQGEEIRRRFSFVSAWPYDALARKPRDRNDSPTLVWYNKATHPSLHNVPTNKSLGPHIPVGTHCQVRTFPTLPKVRVLGRTL
jgi:hypothetical protein